MCVTQAFQVCRVGIKYDRRTRCPVRAGSLLQQIPTVNSHIHTKNYQIAGINMRFNSPRYVNNLLEYSCCAV